MISSLDLLSRGNVIIKYMEDLGNIEFNWSDYEMKVAPLKINVNWTTLANDLKGHQINKTPKVVKKAVLEPVTVKFFAWDKNGVKYDMTKTFMLEQHGNGFEDEQIFGAIKKSLNENDFIKVDFEFRDDINGLPYWPKVCNKHVWSTKE